MSQGSRLRKRSPHLTPKLSVPAKPSTDSGNLVDRVSTARQVASLGQLPETTTQRGTGDSQGEKETRVLAKARRRNRSGPGDYRLRKDEACRLGRNHPSLRVRGCWDGDLYGLRSSWRRGAPTAVQPKLMRGMNDFRDRCLSTSAATNSPPSRWKALGASKRKAAAT